MDECIKTVTVLETVWTNCPDDVKKEVKQMWKDYELGNDTCYLEWDGEEMVDMYPITYKYLKSRGVMKCLIHWWW